jgi:hypothetical protein
LKIQLLRESGIVTRFLDCLDFLGCLFDESSDVFWIGACKREEGVGTESPSEVTLAFSTVVKSAQCAKGAKETLQKFPFLSSIVRVAHHVKCLVWRFCLQFKGNATRNVLLDVLANTG